MSVFASLEGGWNISDDRIKFLAASALFLKVKNFSTYPLSLKMGGYPAALSREQLLMDLLRAHRKLDELEASLVGNVPDPNPNPPDPHVFGPQGSGSISK